MYLLCINTIYKFHFSCQTQQYTKKLAHISLYITIGWTMSLHCDSEGDESRHIGVNSNKDNKAFNTIRVRSWKNVIKDTT
jgi:hypothetical protein